MSQSRGSSTGSGLGLLSVLGVVFVVLKLCHVIDWGWEYVLLPFWGPVALGLIVLLFVAVVFLMAYAADRFNKRGRK